ncbi:hypothetical protein RJT34_22908 [Clitoria ternatea]|uniref:Uncharacterized protein n=1 Tax=Clitoria ternatea TaxID=43366 RepID=A0AAN9FK74_CLITE
MDQRQFHFHPMGICQKVYHFITKTLALQALKTVTLGCSTKYSSSSTAVKGPDSKKNKEVRLETPRKDDNKQLPPTQGLAGGSISSAAVQAEEKNNPCMKIDEKKGENTTLTLPMATLLPTKSLKKTVSINENVEEIPPSKKLKKKRSRSFQRTSSTDQEEEEEPKPPRSILKGGSDLNDKSY